MQNNWVLHRSIYCKPTCKCMWLHLCKVGNIDMKTLTEHSDWINGLSVHQWVEVKITSVTSVFDSSNSSLTSVCCCMQAVIYPSGSGGISALSLSEHVAVQTKHAMATHCFTMLQKTKSGGSEKSNTASMYQSKKKKKSYSLVVLWQSSTVHTAVSLQQKRKDRKDVTQKLH